MTTMQLYWLLKLDDLRDVIFTVSVIMWVPAITIGLIATIAGVSYAILEAQHDDSKASQGVYKATSWAIYIGLPMAISIQLMHNAIPTSKQMAILMVVPKIVNNKSVQQIPQKIINLSNEWLEEFRPSSIKGEEVNE